MEIYSGKSSEKYVGILDNRFFEQLVIIFDYDDNKVYIKPNSSLIQLH